MSAPEDPKKAVIDKSPSRWRQAARRKRLVIIGFTAVIVIIPFCLYYLYFVTSQTSYFSKRNFRVLAAIGEHMSSKAESLANNLRNVAKKAAQDKRAAKHGDSTQEEPARSDDQIVRDAASLVPDFKDDQVKYEPAPAIKSGTPKTAASATNASLAASTTNSDSTGATPGVECAEPPAADPDLITLSVVPESGSFWLHLEDWNTSCAMPGKFSVKSALNTLFEPFASRYVIDELNETNERLFDEVLVADQDGRIIFEQSPTRMNVATLESLLDEKKAKVGLSAAALEKLSNDKDGKLARKLADQPSNLVDVELAGAAYKLFMQPVRLTLPPATDENGLEVRWLVCGLTRTDHFRDATFAAPYTVLISFVFVVLLALLSWPLLRLKLMGPKDRLRRPDLVLTLFSALMGTALVTFILLDLQTYYSLEHTIDGQLKDLSEKIKTNFQDELSSALTQLQKLNGTIKIEAENERSGALRDLIDSGLTNPANAESSGNSAPTFSGKSNILVDWAVWDYPYFNSATWIDTTGQQRIKWTTRRKTTAFLDVSKSEFFKNAKAGTLWKLGSTPAFDYCLEMVKTQNTGENAVIIATRVPGLPWVSSLDTRLFSLMGPALPVGYGYAVIDSGGQVLFHSDEVKNLEEQFFAECENDLWLRAAVVSRISRLMDTKYLGTGHRFYVSAFGGTPWTLVVFADEQMARTINLEVITLSIVLYLLLVVSVVAVISLLGLVKMVVSSGRYRPGDGNWTTWLWPNLERAPQYKLLIAYYVLIASAFAVVWFVGDCSLVIACIALPFLATGLWWLALVWGPAVDCAKSESVATPPVKESKPTLRASFRKLASVLHRFFYAIPLDYLNRVNIEGKGLARPVSIKLTTTSTGGSAISENSAVILLDGEEQGPLTGEQTLSTVVISQKASGKIASGQPVTLQVQNPGDELSGTFIIRHLSCRSRYAIAFAGLLILMSVLPAWGFFKMAAVYELKLMVKHEQVSLVKALEQRRRQVASLDTATEIGDRRAEFLEQRLEPSSSLGKLDVYDSFFFHAGPGDLSQPGLVDETPGPLDWVFLEIRPLYNQRCVESQGLAAAAKSDPLWHWKLDRQNHMLVRKDKDGREGDSSVALQSDIPGMDKPAHFWSWAGLIALALIPLLIYGLVRFVARRFFLLDVDLPPCLDLPAAKGLAGSRVVVWSPMTANGNKWSEKEYHDLNTVKYWHYWTETLTSDIVNADGPGAAGSGTVVLDNFEYCMDDLAANREKLRAIEHLLSVGRVVVVVSRVDPLSFFLKPKHADHEAANTGAAPSESQAIEGRHNGAKDLNRQTPAFCLSEDLRGRWTATFTSLTTVFAADNPTDEFVKAHPELVGILKTSAPWHYIGTIGKALSENGSLPGADCSDSAAVNELISQVGEQARPYHESLWDSCSEGQRCTLIQLAQDGMISPKNKHLRLLVKRGLVVRDPALRLMDESFRRFVILVSRHQDIEGWRQQEGGSAWDLMKAPLLLILVSVALFLFITQKEVYDSGISVISAITAGIAVLFRLLGMFHKDRGGAPIQG